MLDKTQTTAKQIVSLLKDLEGYFKDEQNQLNEEIGNLEATRTKINEIKKIIDATMISDPITLNIGGKKFQTTKATLTRIKGTYFDVMLSGEADIKPMTDTTNTFFIDRDGSNFKYILNYLRDGDINVIPKEVKSEVEREMKFYKIDLPLPPSPSTLIELSHFELINDWIGSKQNYTLLYKGSRDGFDSPAFHRCCNGKGKTITLIKAHDGNVFGGYNSQDWNLNGSYYGDSSCFIFTIVNKQGLAPTRYLGRQMGFGVYQYVRGSAHAGPIFGVSDIVVSGNPTTPTNTIGFPRSYTDTTGLGSQTFTSSTTFIVEDIEVFKV
ncbi:hypothetical protein DFA_06994 [Cavenderia fasciculata]|uniref:TLDc domain-containing protein n=1 Tax=Cavenderia fasciculata TaxID=261658 RepID=F4PX87_CACFS|nr:uncharacterized protein DFA_06994 [Cavenderia fasciculata]EGG19890.1 hypothetical protein DFA_06994 [Cavenderia fasciculata]|eukprot:XP_004366873.1 hypothetical protein DFA_06994 [Cavenderia fasciculata]